MVNVDELPCNEPGYMIVRTSVSDTGIGMSQEYLTKIFDAFTREQSTTKEQNSRNRTWNVDSKEIC